MSGDVPTDLEFQLIRSDPGERRVREALGDLFSGDGTIYLVVGFFTYNGFREIRDATARFLERSPENELKVVVSPSSDQFSSRIARELRQLDPDDQVELYVFERGLHAKLYLRDGPDGHVILTSANLTQVAFRYNVELGIELVGDREHPQIRPFVEWVDELVERARPVRRRDLLGPVQLVNTVINWTNKGRLLPVRHVARRIAPILLLALVFTVGARAV